MATLVFGSGIGRVIGMAATPILTRLYSPEDFGVLAVFTAIVAILAPIVTLRYVLALPLPRHDGVAMNLLAVSMGLILTLSALIALVLWLWGEALLEVVSMRVLAPWWWLIALSVLGTATYEMLTLWATRKRAYKVIAQTNVTQSAAGAAVKIALGLASIQPLGLLIGQVVAQAGGIGRLIRGFHSEFRANWRHVSAERMRKVAWRHRGFPIWQVPSQFLLVFSTQAPMLLCAVFFEPAAVGNLSVAMMLVAIPASLIAQSTARAQYAEASMIRHDPKRLYGLTSSVMKKVAVVSIFPSVVVFLFSPVMLPFFLGEEWHLAGTLASMLSLTMFSRMVSHSVISTLSVIERHDIFLKFNVARLFVVSASLCIPPLLGAGIEYTTLAYALAISLQWFVQSATVIRILRTKNLSVGL
jgi:O-antigen/teichoic acid export membrane protein